MGRNDVWFKCRSVKYGVIITGLMTVEFEDSASAREALRLLVKAIAEAIDADECSIEKTSG